METVLFLFTYITFATMGSQRKNANLTPTSLIKLLKRLRDEGKRNRNIANQTLLSTGGDAFEYALKSNEAWANYKGHQNPAFFEKLATGQTPSIRTSLPSLVPPKYIYFRT